MKFEYDRFLKPIKDLNQDLNELFSDRIAYLTGETESSNLRGEKLLELLKPFIGGEFLEGKDQIRGTIEKIAVLNNVLHICVKELGEYVNGNWRSVEASSRNTYIWSADLGEWNLTVSDFEAHRDGSLGLSPRGQAPIVLKLPNELRF